MRWQAQYDLRVRAQPTTGAEVIDEHTEGAAFRGRPEQGWLVLQDGPGYILILDEDGALIRPASPERLLQQQPELHRAQQQLPQQPQPAGPPGTSKRQGRRLFSKTRPDEPGGCA